MTLVLIACCAKKASTPQPAASLYQSQLFRKSVAYAEAKQLPWAVLSAKHGLLLPNESIAPYDLSLSQLSPSSQRDWAAAIHARLRAEFPNERRFVLLAGQRYIAPLLASASDDQSFTQPLAGMGIGQRLSWLTRQALHKTAYPSTFE